MPRLGVNWSAIAEQALPLIDLIEVPGWQLGKPPESVPLLLHNLDLDFSLAAPHVIDDRWVERASAAIRQTQTPWFSLHLGFSSERVHFQNHMLPDSPPLDRATCCERMTAALRFARERLPVPLLIENLDYCPEGAYEHVCDPTFIADMIERSGCGLLLDLSHAQVSADWLGWEIHDYLGRLPLDRTTEVHLNGPRRLGERLDDSHQELCPSDYDLLDWTLARTTPEVVILEYTRDPAALRDQLRELHRHIEGFS